MVKLHTIAVDTIPYTTGQKELNALQNSSFYVKRRATVNNTWDWTVTTSCTS